MKKEQELKDIVKERYAKIAEQGKEENASSCCGATTPTNKVYNMMHDCSSSSGYVAAADVILASGLPTQFAPRQQEGPAADLCSVARNSPFVARRQSALARNVFRIESSPTLTHYPYTSSPPPG